MATVRSPGRGGVALGRPGRRRVPRVAARLAVPFCGLLAAGALLGGCVDRPPPVTAPSSGPPATAVAAPSGPATATAGPPVATAPVWADVADTPRLPEHFPSDVGPIPGATGTATVLEDGDIRYEVAEGDQLGYIAARFFPDDPVGHALNLISAVDDHRGLVPGKVLVIPSGR